MNRIELLRKLRGYNWSEAGWYVPLTEALRGVGPAEAAWQPPGGGNSIWQTVVHLNFYNEQLLARMTGQEPAPHPTTNDETFVVPTGAEAARAWAAELERTHRIGEGLQAALAALTEEELDQVPPGGKAPRVAGLAAWMQHDAYHTGQIVLLRKLQAAWTPHAW